MSAVATEAFDLVAQIRALRAAGDLSQAAQSSAAAVKSFPKNAQLRAEQGLTLFDMQDYENAIAAFDEALNLEPNDIYAQESKAIGLRQLGRNGEAAAFVDAVLLRDPENTLLLRQRAWIYLDQGNFESANSLADRLVKALPYDENTLAEKSVMLRRQRRWADAEAHVRNALKTMPGSAVLLNEIGWIKFEQNQYDDALSAFAETLKVATDDEKALELTINILRKKGRYKDAEEVATSALRRHLRNADLRNQLAWVYADQNRNEDAMRAFDETLRLFPDNESALLWKSYLLRRQRKFAEAESLIAAGLARRPNGVALRNELGNLYEAQAQHDKAIAYCDETLRLYPGNEEALLIKSRSLRQQREFVAADSMIVAALQNFARSSALLIEHGFIFFDQQRYEQALTAFNEALSVDPDNDKGAPWAVASLRRMGRFADAQKTLTAALQANPRNVALLREQGWLQFDQKRYVEAIRAFDEILKIEASNEDALVWKSTSLRQQREYADAEKLITGALARLPDSILLRNERGWIQYDQKQYGRAIECFDDTLRFDPDNDEALRWKSISLRHLKKRGEAEDVVAQALQRLPRSVALLVEMGWILVDQERYQAAERHFASASEKYPHDFSLLTGRVEALKRLEKDDEAIEVQQGYKRAHESHVDVRIQLGWAYLYRKETGSAKREFEEVLAADSGNINALNGLAAVDYNEGRYEQAEQGFLVVVERDLGEAVFHRNLAWALVRQVSESPSPEGAALGGRKWFAFAPFPVNKPESRQRSLDKAEEHCRIARKLRPEDASTHGCLGVIAVKRGRLLDAERFFESSIKLDAKEGNHVDLGTLCAQMGRYDEAKQRFADALKIDKNDSNALQELGYLHLELNEIGNATRFFRHAMHASPQSEEPPHGLAIALMRGGNHAEAGRVLRGAIRQLDHDKRWRLHLTLSQLMTEIADKNDDPEVYDEALKEASEAIALKPNHADPYFHAGVIRFKQQDYRGAQKAFDQCLRRNPDHLDAQRNMRLVKSLSWQERMRTRGSVYAGIVMGVICLALLLGLWVLYLNQQDSAKKMITDAMMITFSPILVGLAIVAYLLPWLYRLKLPGVEAELSQPKDKVSTGSVGTIGFASGPASARRHYG